MATNYVHLNKEQRSTIEYLINNGKTFTYISNSIKVDRTTISKEIRRNRFIKNSLFSEYSEFGISKALNSCVKLSKPPYCCNNCKDKTLVVNIIYITMQQKHISITTINYLKQEKVLIYRKKK